MNIKQALFRARMLLAGNDIEDASIESEVLLRHVLGIDRARLLASLDADISPEQRQLFMKLIARRSKGEPTAYITGHREFYGLDFRVNRHVLIPRPETELLVDKAISLCRENGYLKIADIGTGCGAIAVSMAVNLPSVTIYATDIYTEAVETARQNGVNHSTEDRMTFLRGDLLEPLPEPVDMIIANLPYVRQRDIPDKGPLSYEPAEALNGGEKGLDKIGGLCSGAGNKLKANGTLILEIGQGQGEAVKGILHKYFPSAEIKIEKDLAGIERMATIRLTQQ
ncbi:MAG: peptide chain release factor N(5)-glutamine methyltransferase [Dehalococcoidales bacterium]|nr:peptide chain release factor N(5)-glutamine methyltransferase [Dehalococcoidales bacterium]